MTASCARCGALSPAGPAADLGFPICADCLAWRCPRPEMKQRVRFHRMTRLAVVLGAFSIVLLLMFQAMTTVPGTPISTLQLLLVPAALLCTVLFFALMLWSLAYRYYYLWHWPRRSADLLGFDLERLRAACAPGTLVKRVAHIEAPAAKIGREETTVELAYLAANERGVLVYGPVLERLAAPWSALTVDRAAWARGCAHLAPRAQEGRHHFVYPFRRLRTAPRIFASIP